MHSHPSPDSAHGMSDLANLSKTFQIAPSKYLAASLMSAGKTNDSNQSSLWAVLHCSSFHNCSFIVGLRLDHNDGRKISKIIL